MREDRRQRACGEGVGVSKMPLDRFTVLLERSGEAIENVKEAIRLTLEYRREHGLPLPEHVEMVAEVEV